MDPGARPPARERIDTRPIRWGLGDFVWIYIAGLLLGGVLGVIGAAITSDHSGTGALTIALSSVGQFGGWAAMCAVVSRSKGRGSLRLDFGLVVRPQQGWALFAGIGLFLVGTAVWAPIRSLVNENQAVVDELKKATGAELVVFAIVAGLVAPICEELMFRGLLLRSLRRRWSPAVAIAIQALAFALAHPMLSPTLGDLSVVPTLFLMGAVSGILASRRGDLSASILLHIGFNLITVLAAL